MLGAIVTLAGIVLSGPVSLLLVRLHPQPGWRGAEAFVRAYHPIQTLPYFTGFILVGGSLFLISALQALAPAAVRARAAAALGFAAAFAGMIFFNYVVQTTFVPALVREYRPEEGPIIAAFSLSNPRALGWGLEMWGYAVLGVATWLVAPAFNDFGRLGRVTGSLFVANGPISILGAVLTARDPGWVLSPAGFVLFGLWNLLMLVMMTLAAFTLSPRRRVLEQTTTASTLQDPIA
jgi:hypothetical protein